MKIKDALLLLLASLFLASCMAAGVKSDAKAIRVTNSEPVGCKYKGEAIGSLGNSMTGKYTMVKSMQKGAMNRLKNKAYKLGGDTVVILDKSQSEGVTKKGKNIVQNITITGGVYRCHKK